MIKKLETLDKAYTRYYMYFQDGDIDFENHMNNEKKSEDVFGFKDIDDYFDNEVVRNEAEHLKTLFRTAYGSDFTYDANGNSYYDLCHNFVDDEDPDSVINPTECWEFSNNNFSIPNMSNYTKGIGSKNNLLKLNDNIFF